LPELLRKYCTHSTVLSFAVQVLSTATGILILHRNSTIFMSKIINSIRYNISN